jgi:cell division cycle 20-like protein 1, cofactor of APC complex
MDTSIDMIYTDVLPQIDCGTPRQITPMNKNDKKETISASTPETMSSYSSASTPQGITFATTSTNRMEPKKLLIPSPSRPRLDPRYAVRLPEYKSLEYKPPLDVKAPSSPASSDKMSPPSLRRCESGTQSFAFHPTPIISPMNDSFMDVSYESFNTPTTGTSDTWYPPTPDSTRSNQNRGICSDRYIPSRGASNYNINLWDGIAERSAQIRTINSSYNANSDIDNMDTSTRSMPDTSTSGDASINGGNNTPSPQLNTFAALAQQNLLGALLRTEVFGENVDPTRIGGGLTPTTSATNHFRFTNYRQHLAENRMDPAAVVNSFSLTPMNNLSERLIATPCKRKRRISKVPFKVLDAPALQDDFYLNLVDWSSHNVLAVGLGACVYLWSACTSKVTKLCDLSINDDTVTAVSWAQRGTHLSVGTNKGEVQLWDTIKCKKVRSMSGHTARVGALAWTGPILASGSRDRLIYLRDVRVQSPFTDKLSNHRQEVCGLKWSFEEPAFLASGGNDNNLHVFDSRNPSEPLHKFSEHTAAVKAIAWSPHQHGLLASGGGTADRCIRFHNTLSGASLNRIDTGSQVCNLAWSQNCNELVSTHGYSLNQIVVWRYPSMSKVATLTGHTFRVLYLAMSPDGSTVVTGAGDETLRFWQIFPGPRSDGKDSSGGLLFPNTLGSVIR